MAAFSFSDSFAGRLTQFVGRMGQSRFFVISVALHFVLVLLGGSVVLFKAVNQHKDVDEQADGPLVQAAPAPPTESVQPLAQPADPTLTQPVSAPTITSATALTTLATTNAFSLPSSTLDTPASNGTRFAPQATQTSAVSTTNARPNDIPMAQAKKMVAFTQDWAKKGEAGSGVNKSRSFKFTAYLAKYSGGDWDSTIQMAGNKIAKGSLPNLLYVMRKWSRDKIDAEPDPVPLELSSEEIFVKKPPFILFTGHQDFVLTDLEVENLRKYLQLGGCIWGDSSLPGNRSRFDLAFRREMKRILPDQDIQWETLPPNHPVYTQTYYPEITRTPTGMNYYQEPVYALKNFGEISVLYTANDYGDLLQIALTEKGEFDLRRVDVYGDYVATNGTLFDRRTNYFRGLDLKPVNDSYKFSTNVILHLLTRWEDKLRNVPTGL